MANIRLPLQTMKTIERKRQELIFSFDYLMLPIHGNINNSRANKLRGIAATTYIQ